jgi:Putative restriction endonuclease
MLVQTPLAKTEPIISWESLPDDFILPDDPVENLQQPLLAAALTDALSQAGLIKPQMLIASNFGLVATVDQKIVVKAPDWLYIPQAEPLAKGAKIRRSYTQNLQGDRVAIVMEFLSHVQGGELSMKATYPYGKLYFYEQILQVPIYVVFEPFRPKLEVRSLQSGGYVLDSPDQYGRFWIPQFELFLGIWPGERNDILGNWLRWWDSSGKMLSWSFEQVAEERQQTAQARQELEQVRQQAELFAKKLQELGIDPAALT